MKILIISYYFPPVQSFACQRVESFARYLTEFGHEVTVLTHGDNEETRQHGDGYTLVRIPSRLINWLLKRLGYLRKDKSEQEQASQTTRKPWQHIMHRVDQFRAKRGLGFLGRMPDFTDFWYLACRRWIRQCDKYDVVLSSYAPYSSHLIAAYAKSLNRSDHWVADFRDLWTDHHLFAGLFPFTMLEAVLEKRLVAQTDLITTVSQPLADRLRSKHGKCPEVIFNGYENLADANLIQAESTGILYTGTLYSEHQDIFPILQALQQYQEQNTGSTLRLSYAGQSGDTLQGLSPELQEFVDNRGNLNYEGCLALQRRASCLLYIDFNIPEYDGILPTKLFEYIGSGRPILALTGNTSSAACNLLKNVPHATILKNTVAATLGYLTSIGDPEIEPSTSLPTTSEFTRHAQASKLNEFMKLLHA